jgi:hypothetical protein
MSENIMCRKCGSKQFEIKKFSKTKIVPYYFVCCNCEQPFELGQLENKS